MRIIPTLMLVIISINLTACSTMSGNVVPEQGPTMEKVYDNMEVTKIKQKPKIKLTLLKNDKPARVDNSFHKLPNPTLKIYVYPHFARNDELPVPGYETVFNAYERDHYFLQNELI